MKNELKNFVRSRNGLIQNLTGKREPDILPLNINSNFTVTKKRRAKAFTELVNFCLFYINIMKIYNTHICNPLLKPSSEFRRQKRFFYYQEKFIFRNKNAFFETKIHSKFIFRIKNSFFESKLIFRILTSFFESKFIFRINNSLFDSKFIFRNKNHLHNQKNHFRK